jgi:SHS2 domain-containing protein
LTSEILVTGALVAPDDELLLFSWLNAIIYQTAITGMIFGRYTCETRADGLWGWAIGEPIDDSRHDIACEVKGATLTAIKAIKLGDGTFLAQCVVDV